MSNFVLVDAPNFVLVDEPEPADASPPAREYVNPCFGELLRLLAVSIDGASLGQALVFDDRSAPRMRRILARYGFELPPLTLAELLGLLDYCDRLDALTGCGLLAEHQQVVWQQLTRALGPCAGAPSREALGLFARGELAGLRRLHRTESTLARLGRDYRLPGI